MTSILEKRLKAQNTKFRDRDSEPKLLAHNRYHNCEQIGIFLVLQFIFGLEIFRFEVSFFFTVTRRVARRLVS